MSSTCALRRSAPVIVLASAGESKHHAPMLRQSVAAVTLVVALFAVCACSEGGGPRERPASLSLSASGSVCVDLTRDGDVETSWCAKGITSFDVELPYENPEHHYGLLLVVSGRLLPSTDYVIWDEQRQFLLVASSHSSTSLRDLTYLVESGGQTLRCSGKEKFLQCIPQSP